MALSRRFAYLFPPVAATPAQASNIHNSYACLRLSPFHYAYACPVDFTTNRHAPWLFGGACRITYDSGATQAKIMDLPDTLTARSIVLTPRIMALAPD